jgi:sugar lactone lactonase YvrE
MNNPHGNMIDLRDPAKPILLVADRGNQRIVRYTLDDKPIDVVAGTLQPCHFHEHKGMIVVPDLASRVTLLDKDNKVVAHLGEGLVGNPPRTTDDRSKFVPGQFVNPHGACFDHAGNIFVAEWVEIGRVTETPQARVIRSRNRSTTQASKGAAWTHDCSANSWERWFSRCWAMVLSRT